MRKKEKVSGSSFTQQIYSVAGVGWVKQRDTQQSAKKLSNYLFQLILSLALWVSALPPPTLRQTKCF